MPVKEKKKDTTNIYSVAALAKVLGISKQALFQRVEQDNLPFNISIDHYTASGKVRLSYDPTL